ncbi:hypothetical protein H4582DRAFT_2100957 [Lactarius indigo]|nr:hypothetical protein H4582DRAFT_2100957 [Lactarius indigo]
MTAPQHDIAVDPKTVIPKSPLKGPQLSHVLLTQPSAIHDQQSFDFETMEIFAKAEKKRLGFLNSPDKYTPSLPSPIQVLDDVPSTGPQASLNSSVTGSDCASSPESPSPMLASASHGPSRPRLSSVPDPDAVAGQSEGFIAERNDALDPPSAIRGNIMAASVLPPSNGQYDIV